MGALSMREPPVIKRARRLPSLSKALSSVRSNVVSGSGAPDLSQLLNHLFQIVLLSKNITNLKRKKIKRG